MSSRYRSGIFVILQLFYLGRSTHFHHFTPFPIEFFQRVYINRRITSAPHRRGMRNGLLRSGSAIHRGRRRFLPPLEDGQSRAHFASSYLEDLLLLFCSFLEFKFKTIFDCWIFHSRSSNPSTNRDSLSSTREPLRIKSKLLVWK